MLRDLFEETILSHLADKKLCDAWWQELETAYSHKRRHYHTLSHLQHIFDQVTPYRNKIEDWHTLTFSVFYHDAVYNPLRGDNEEKSAKLAVSRLRSINYPDQKITRCHEQIIATKLHNTTGGFDTDIFIDADLSILGADWPMYEDYCKKIRKEYSIFPGLVYNPGRKKVLKHFLQMPRIFKTREMYSRYESQARANMKQELENL
ncbi:MAG: hypothetical protein ACOYXT_17010 [Bacteroidota bacterium]